jgi:hypothetical protein
MSEIRRSAKERETMGWQTALIGAVVVVLGLINASPWALLIGVVLAIVGGIMWGAGMARSDN